MSSLRQKIDTRFKLSQDMEGVLLYKTSARNDIDKDLYLKQRDSFIKNFRLLRTKYRCVNPESELDVAKINEQGYKETAKIENYDPIYSSDIFYNTIPTLEEEEKAIKSNSSNVKFLFFKYKCLSFLTHTLNTVYSDTTRPLILKSILKSQLEGLISGFLDLYQPKSYIKIDEGIVLVNSEEYLLMNRIDFWNDSKVDNLESLYKASNRFKVYDNGYKKAMTILGDDNCPELKAIEHQSCFNLYYTLRNSTDTSDDLLYETTKRLVNEYEEAVKDILDKYFNETDFVFENKESPIKRINVYHFSNVISIIGEEHILKRIKDGYRIIFRCGKNYLIVKPKQNGIDFHQHIKLENHKLTYSNYYNVVFMVESIKYELNNDMDENDLVKIEIDYEYNDDIKMIFSKFLDSHHVGGIDFNIKTEDHKLQVEKDRLFFSMGSDITQEEFKNLGRTLSHMLHY